MSIKNFGKKVKNYINIPFMGYYKPKESGTPLLTIPVFDVRDGKMTDVIEPRKKEARQMIVKSRQTFGWVSRILSLPILPVTDFLSKRWLKRTKNPYTAEIREASKKVKRMGTHTLNLCYEWGCTTGTFATGDTNTMARVQDWPLPLLGENLIVAHQKGEAGDFYNVTWPAYSGMIQGMAPGRFSAAINKAPVRRSKRSALRDWFHNRGMVGRRKALPPPHLLRQAFEKAANYAEAKKMLLETPLTMPAIFILSGTKPDEGCIIERIDDYGVVREMQAGRVVAANHFESSLNGNGDVWKCRVGNGMQRSDYARNMSADDVADQGGFPWFKEGSAIATHFARIVMTADAAKGTMLVAGMGGEKPVTEILKIGPAA